MRQIRRFALMAAALLMFFFLTAVPAKAGSANVEDNAGLLTQQELQKLQEKAAEISSKYEVGVYIRTFRGMEGYGIEEYGDYIFERDHLGYGSDRHMIMLVIDMDSSMYDINAYGYGNTAFTDYGKQQMADDFLDDLSDGYYYEAFDTFLDDCDYYLTKADEGEIIDVPGQTEAEKKAAKEAARKRNLGISGGTGLLSSLLVCLGLKSRMKTTGRKTTAGTYIREHGVHMRHQADYYHGTTRTVTPLPRNNSSGGGGGGSSGGTTISSSGHSHHSGHF
ncbi:MAG: TPM domain-containing protein [Solobacterium sp.]|nr:TPM domain-containing protein [Solobacterium sp.]